MLEKNYHTGYSKAPGFQGIHAQTQIDNRYFTEDVGYGLVLLEDMSRSIGVESPVISSIIILVSVLLETDFQSKALRTLHKLGLANLSRDEMIEAVQ